MRILALLAATLIPVKVYAVPEAPRRDATFTSHVPNVRDFGARGDGVADDTDAIQAAIDYVKPGAAVVNSAAYGSRTGRVFVPLGHYLVRHPIRLYSGVWLDGAGQGSTIEAASDFPRSEAILKSSTEGLSPQGYGGCAVTNLHLKARGGSGIWAFSHSEMKSVGTLRAENLWIETPKGLDLTPYTQNSSVRNVLFTGEIDQMLRVKGNFNTFEQLDKEGATGGGDEPYIQVEGHTAGASSSNHFRQILIEQITSPRKSLFSATGADELVLEDFWLEPTKTNGYGVILDRCHDFQIRGHFSHLGSWGKFAVRGGSWGSIETLNADGEDVPWSSVFEVDGASFLRTGKTFSRRSGNALPFDAAARVEHGPMIDRMLTVSPKPGISPVSRPRDLVVQNLLVNPSFEHGAYGWSMPTGFMMRDFTAAEVGPGAMLRLGGGVGSGSVRQELDVPPSWVGHPLTLSFLGRVSGEGFVAPLVQGAGVDLGQDSFRITGENGWILAAVSFTPLSPGRLSVGAWLCGAKRVTNAYLDEFRLAFGSEGVPAGGQFQELELGGATLIVGSGPPTAGTWRAGDIMLNRSPGAAGPLGWRAVSAGSPGAWEAVPVPLRGVASVDALSVEGQRCIDAPVPVPGSLPGGECVAGVWPDVPAGVVTNCRVAEPGVAVARLCNVTSARQVLERVRLSARVFNP